MKTGKHLPHSRMLGSIVFNVLISMIGVFLLALVLAIAFYEGRKAYWDFRIERMCQKDGGATVFEKIRLTQDEYERLGGRMGEIPIPERETADASAAFVADRQDKIIREGSPSVWRAESTIYALDDNRQIARFVSYTRRGGDFPTYQHPSYFRCNNKTKLTSKKIFIIEGID